MSHNYFYNVLPIADCEDVIQWEAHRNAVANLIRYAVKGLYDELSQDAHVDFDVNEATLKQVLQWCTQLKLIEVQK